jgi:hypothetical protein
MGTVSHFRLCDGTYIPAHSAATVFSFQADEPHVTSMKIALWLLLIFGSSLVDNVLVESGKSVYRYAVSKVGSHNSDNKDRHPALEQGGVWSRVLFPNTSSSVRGTWILANPAANMRVRPSFIHRLWSICSTCQQLDLLPQLGPVVPRMTAAKSD